MYPAPPPLPLLSLSDSLEAEAQVLCSLEHPVVCNDYGRALPGPHCVNVRPETILLSCACKKVPDKPNMLSACILVINITNTWASDCQWMLWSLVFGNDRKILIVELVRLLPSWLNLTLTFVEVKETCVPFSTCTVHRLLHQYPLLLCALHLLNAFAVSLVRVTFSCCIGDQQSFSFFFFLSTNYHPLPKNKTILQNNNHRNM